MSLDTFGFASARRTDSYVIKLHLLLFSCFIVITIWFYAVRLRPIGLVFQHISWKLDYAQFPAPRKQLIQCTWWWKMFCIRMMWHSMCITMLTSISALCCRSWLQWIIQVQTVLCHMLMSFIIQPSRKQRCSSRGHWLRRTDKVCMADTLLPISVPMDFVLQSNLL